MIKMKVKHACMAMTALAMAACSQNEITELNPDVYSPVGFSIYTGAQTRGKATTTATIQAGDKFAILAYYTEKNAWAGTTETPNFMYNQEVSYNDGTEEWSYNPAKFWPSEAGNKISFFAYAPYEGNPATGLQKGIILSNADAAGKPSITFKLQNSADKMVDLVTDMQKDREKASGTVSFTLKHVLTRATFVAKLSKDLSASSGMSHVFVTGMEILGTESNPASKFYNQAKYTFDSDSPWSEQTAAAPNYPLTAIMDIASQSEVISGYPSLAVDLTKTSEKSLFKAGEYLYLIPLAGGIGGNTEVKVKLSYSIVTKDDQVTGGYTEVKDEIIVALPNGTLQANTSYKYAFTINIEEIAVDVKVNAIVEDWTDDKPGDLNNP